MTLNAISYLLPDGLDLGGFKKILTESNHVSEDAPVTAKQTYYDSFDWRVWQAGGEVVHGLDQPNQLCWMDRKNFSCVACQRVDANPGFADDMPDGPLAERLTAVLAMRVLLPKANIIQKKHTLHILDNEKKTIVRVVLENNRYTAVRGKQKGNLNDRIVLKPLKGYEDQFIKFKHQLAALKVKPAEQSLYEDALVGIGQKPGDYSSKLNYRLDPDAPADATARQIMIGLLNTLEMNISGTKANLDSEFLHDLRVATRRTRSAMSQMKGVFDPEQLEPFKQGFGWIGKVTGETRDLDVYLLHYPSFLTDLPKALQDDLDPFYSFLQQHHKKTQAELVKEINSPYFRKILKSWRDWLQSSPEKSAHAPHASSATTQLADQRISKLYKRVLKNGSTIVPDSPAEQLHDLRKQCKKLRYLMEFFQSLYSKPAIRELIKALKIILDNLGEFQDSGVQAQSLEYFGDQMLKEGAPASSPMAMGILVDQLLEKQVEARKTYVELFAGFSSESNQQAFRKLFGGA